MDEVFELHINDAVVNVRCPGSTPLALVLRNHLGLCGTRIGCALEQCRACTVMIDGTPHPSCTREIQTVVGQAVTTIEGLAGGSNPHPLMQALVDEQAGQCGFCLAGITVTAAALLRDVPDPTRADVVAALDPHLCRCGSHNRIIRAVLKASKEAADDSQHPAEESGG
jgi:aerobic-type carbon monoxide dehydrogenase small subunit (CoxS/CutS family)